MANYNTIRGLRVKYLSADPANPENGQVWYNSTTGSLRVASIGSSFSSMPTLNTGRQFVSGGGTTNASLIWAGSPGSGLTEGFNGSSWSVKTSLSTARENATQGFGVSTAAVCSGGYVGGPGSTNATEEFNGSSWTGGGNMNLPVYASGGAGIESAGVKWGGDNLPGVRRTNATEEYNGSSWTTTGNLGSANYYARGVGTQTAALSIGGNPPGSPPVYTNLRIQYYDGSSWTLQPQSTNFAKTQGGTCGNQTDAVYFGGAINGPVTAIAESWDGSSWTNLSATMATARNIFATGGGNSTSTSGYAAGGNGPTNAAEEFNGAQPVATLSTS